MGRNNILYDRNHVKRSNDNLDLYVDGTLKDAILEAAYEGRLQIHNNIGACSVEVTSGADQLPEGYQVYVDNSTYEVVVAWPSRFRPPPILENPGFETGDLTGWTYSTKGGGGAPVVTTAHPNPGSYSAYWAGGKGLGSEGGIECTLLNNTECKIFPGQYLNVSANILYNPDGGTPKGSRGQVQIHWFNDTGLVDITYGFLVKTRKYNGKWTVSNASGRAPKEANKAKAAVWLTATGAGHSYCDNLWWDAKIAPVGTDELKTIYLCLRVRDSAGRTADWCGSIKIVEETVWVVGGVDPSGNTGYTTTGTQSLLWETPILGSASSSNLEYASNGVLYTAALGNGYVARSLNLGKTWEDIHYFTSIYSNAGKIASNNSVLYYAASLNGCYVYKNDAWSQVSITPTTELVTQGDITYGMTSSYNNDINRYSSSGTFLGKGNSPLTGVPYSVVELGAGANEDRLVVAYSNPSLGTKVSVSLDGANSWTTSSYDFNLFTGTLHVHWTGEKFLLWSQTDPTGKIFYSDDALNWELSTLALTGIRAMASGMGKTLLVAGTKFMLSEDNGVTWVNTPAPPLFGSVATIAWVGGDV